MRRITSNKICHLFQSYIIFPKKLFKTDKLKNTSRKRAFSCFFYFAFIVDTF